ncbi:hypothetical protein BC830DRAFT_1089461 [Chytriomyces sp. MP71]|nr:hypothetical protein BC830DRAFT_1089461 [Chytriomyces sp. MP71]
MELSAAKTSDAVTGRDAEAEARTYPYQERLPRLRTLPRAWAKLMATLLALTPRPFSTVRTANLFLTLLHSHALPEQFAVKTCRIFADGPGVRTRPLTLPLCLSVAAVTVDPNPSSILTVRSLISATSRPTTGPTKESSASGRAPTCGATMAKYLASTSAPQTKSAASKLANAVIHQNQTRRRVKTTLGALSPRIFPAARRDAALTVSTTATTFLTELVSALASTRSRTASTKKYSHSQGQ